MPVLEALARIARFANLLDRDGNVSISNTLVLASAVQGALGLYTEQGYAALVPLALTLLNYAHKRSLSQNPIDPASLLEAVEEAKRVAAQASADASAASLAAGVKSLRRGT